MNIIINNYCNLNCEYCFANDVIAENKKSMTLKDFHWVLDFIRESGRKEVRIIGGEPTLHPQFSEFVLESLRQPFINHLHVFTNGTYNERIGYLFHIASLSKGVSLLINLNDPSVIGKEKTKVIAKNLDSLKGTNIKVTLGINFYKENQDYQYLIDAAKAFGIKNIRWSITVPNTDEKRNFDVKEYFESYIPTIKQFLVDVVKAGLKPHVDCNNIPLCLLDDEALRVIAMVSEANLKTSICNPIIDIKPDLTAIRCFALDDYVVNAKDFTTIAELNSHFSKNVDGQYNGAKLFDVCESCESYQVNGKACACLAFAQRNRDIESKNNVMKLQTERGV